VVTFRYRFNTVMPPEALAWNTRSDTVPAIPAQTPRDRVMSILLDLQTSTPSPMLSLTIRRTQKARDEVLVNHGLSRQHVQDGLDDFIPRSEYFQSVLAAPEDILDWTRAPRFSESALAQDHLLSVGITQGMSFAFMHRDRVVGSGHFHFVGVTDFSDAQYRALDQARVDLQAEIAAYVIAGDVGLTCREREILRLVADGLSNTQISDTLTVSRHTVNTHVEHILTKLRVSNRVQAVRIAAIVGLV